MNDRTYPDNARTACQDCNSALCLTCYQKYVVPICDGCNLVRLNKERDSIKHEFLMYGSVFCAAVIYFGYQSFSVWMVGASSSLLWVLPSAYVLSGWYAGGKSLQQAGIHQQTGTTVTMLSLLFYIIWFVRAALVGIFALPIRLVASYRRLGELKNLVKTIEANIEKGNSGYHSCNLQVGGGQGTGIFYNPSDN